MKSLWVAAAGGILVLAFLLRTQQRAGALSPQRKYPKPTIIKPEEARDVVDEASLESFPASDAPAW